MTKTYGDTGRSAACTPHHGPAFNFCTGDTLKHSLPLHEWKPLQTNGTVTVVFHVPYYTEVEP